MADEQASLKIATQSFQPDLSRGVNYARWKSQPPNKALQEKGLTLPRIQRELKQLHNVSSAAYNRHEIVCSKLPLQLVANFSLVLSVTSFIIFVAALLISGSLSQIRETLNETDMVSQAIVDHVNLRYILMICAICSLMTISFMFIGTFIMYKDKDSKYNQYIASILAVHEYIHSKCDDDKGIVLKMIQNTKRTNKTNLCGSKRTVKYYSIVLKVREYQKVNDIDQENISDNEEEEEEETSDEDEVIFDDDDDENDLNEEYLIGSNEFDDQPLDDYDFSVSETFAIKNKILNFGFGHKNRLYLDEIASSTNDCSQFEIGTPTLSKIPLLESEEEDSDNPFV